MSTLAPTMQPASSLRRLIARHPVATFLIMAFTVSITIAFVRLRTNGDIQSPLYEYPLVFLEHLFSVALPAFLVVAAIHGKAGVRDLARRSLRWRVGTRWYLLALLGLPIASVLCASVIYGVAPLNALVDNWQLLFTLILPTLLIRFAIFQLCGRFVNMWLYNNTNRSVLLVGMFHATYNTTTNTYAGEFIPVPAEPWFFIVSGVVAVAAVLIILITRGRLSYKPNYVSQIADVPLTKE
jgi:hypothetical protein